MEHKRPRKKAKTITTNANDSEEVSSKEWSMIDMSEQEEDLINRMHRLVGDRQRPSISGFASGAPSYLK